MARVVLRGGDRATDQAVAGGVVWRYPDKPVRGSVETLKRLEGSREYVAQVKRDGWRCLTIVRHGEIEFQSRHRKPCNVNTTVRAAVKAMNLPPLTVIDGEWLGRRDVKKLNGQGLYLFDVMFVEGEWQGGKPLVHRFEILQRLCGSMPEPISMVENVRLGFTRLYEMNRGKPLVEGVVLKRLDSTLIGSTRESADNPSWAKVRYVD